ncbi:MAG: glycoside hydrolase [Kiritimatiellae bacterium]|nr:glycoside hydrolase [Kiritimatiellia bacterium]
MTWSDDEGQSWCLPVAPFVPPSIEGRLGLFRAAQLTALGGNRVVAVIYWVDYSDPSHPFFNEATEGLLDSRIFLSFSEDGGETWSAPVPVNTTPFHVPTPITGPILLMQNGEWALQFETNKTYYDTSVWHHASILMFSNDRGKSWPRHARVTFDPQARMFYWDQRPGVLSDGRILDLFWTFDRERGVYLNIHACESFCQGHIWSELWDTGVPGQPAPPVALSDGRIAMVYVDRTGAPVIKLRTSADWGRTWASETERIIYAIAIRMQEGKKRTMQDTWSEMGAYSVGLPATALIPGGDILVVYYAGLETDRTNVEWVRVRLG